MTVTSGLLSCAQFEGLAHCPHTLLPLVLIKLLLIYTITLSLFVLGSGHFHRIGCFPEVSWKPPLHASTIVWTPLDYLVTFHVCPHPGPALTRYEFQRIHRIIPVILA